MRKIISYIFTIPACTLFFFAEKIRGEKIAWRHEEIIDHYLAIKPTQKCTKCGHEGNLHLEK